MNNVEHIYDQVFREKTAGTNTAFAAYRKIYDLPDIRGEFKSSRIFFDHVKSSRIFAVLALYDSHGRIFLSESDPASWSLPGASIHPKEGLHGAVQRIAQQTIPNVKIGEIEPVAHVENVFKIGDDTHAHRGLAFIARVRNLSALNLPAATGRFVLVNDEILDGIKLFANKEIVKRCVARLGERQTEIQEDEIATNEACERRYALHETLVKKCILTSRRKRKKEFFSLLASNVDPSGPLLDVSCGDADTLNHVLAAHPDIPVAVANDLSWSQVLRIRSEHPAVIFTNHDATDLPFRDSAFATTLCLNTLHHMPTRRHMQRLFFELSRVSRNIVFVEIENPQVTGGFPRYLNKYWYEGFLKDVGGAYLSRDQFQGIVQQTYGGKANVEFGAFRNVQGNYLLATVRQDCSLG